MISSWHLFERFGVELEYMLVDWELSVLPAVDELLRSVAGEYVSDVEQGDVTWSNELVAHVVELKTTEPATSLAGLAGAFQSQIGTINELLAPLGGRLMPTAMHPWMDPWRETKLWDHDYSEVYEAYNRIFDCRGHGWSNLQSVHINLPFASDEEFGRLHAAIRLVLPLLPALAASSPIVGGQATGFLDNRLEMYRQNSRKIPSITGRVIPEPVFAEEAYRRDILGRMYAEIAPFDAAGVLQDEFLNSRGAIARFSRGTIEIRVLDIQECPQADLAIVSLVTAVLRALVDERWASWEDQQSWQIEPLEKVFLATVRDGERAVIDDARYLGLWGLQSQQATAQDVWCRLAEATLLAEAGEEPACRDAMRHILHHGTLARRILKATGPEPAAQRLAEVFSELCECLAMGRMFSCT